MFTHEREIKKRKEKKKEKENILNTQVREYLIFCNPALSLNFTRISSVTKNSSVTISDYFAL